MDLPFPQQRRSAPPPQSGGARSTPSDVPAGYQEQVLRRLNFSCHMIPQCVNVGVAPILLRPAEARFYFFIQNTHLANTIAINFDSEPEINYKGVIMGPRGFYEPAWVPDNEIWIVASAVNTTVFFLIATQLASR